MPTPTPGARMGTTAVRAIGMQQSERLANPRVRQRCDPADAVLRVGGRDHEDLRQSLRDK